MHETTENLSFNQRIFSELLDDAKNEIPFNKQKYDYLVNGLKKTHKDYSLKQKQFKENFDILNLEDKFQEYFKEKKQQIYLLVFLCYNMLCNISGKEDYMLGKKSISGSISMTIIIFMITISSIKWYFCVLIALGVGIFTYFFGIIRILFWIISKIFHDFLDDWIENFDD